jgi:hypothetical protein
MSNDLQPLAASRLPASHSGLEEESPMERNRFIEAALCSVAFAILASPALAMAQAAPQSGGGGGWLLLVIFGALAVAITVFTVSQRRKFPKNEP